MSELIPLFPLDLVAFPGESLNLHIFEPRYKQLINDCLERDIPFGIATMIDGELMMAGTLINILSVEKTYEGGEMDIKTKAVAAFTIDEFFKEVPGKLYGGGSVSYLSNADEEDKVFKIRLVDHLNEFYRLLQPIKPVTVDLNLVSFDIAHKVGLTLAQEAELLMMEHETERQVYILNHLKTVIPVLEQMEVLKKRIQMNGHFKKMTSGEPK